MPRPRHRPRYFRRRRYSGKRALAYKNKSSKLIELMSLVIFNICLGALLVSVFSLNLFPLSMLWFFLVVVGNSFIIHLITLEPKHNEN